MIYKTIRFGDLYDINSRNGLSKPSKVRGSGFKMINMGELFSNDRIYDIPMELVPLNIKEKIRAKVEIGDLLFARQSLVLKGAGKCSIVMEISPLTVFESHLIRVRLNKDANSLFYYYYFQSPFSPMKSIVSQCAQAGIRGSDLQELIVIYPPKKVQNKIANILNNYDLLIENNQKQIKLLEEAAQRLYKEWFVDLRFPGHENTKIIDGIPEGWKKTIIGEYLKVKSGYAFKSSWWQSSGNPVVKIKNIDNNTIDFSSIDYVPPEHTLKTTDFKLNKGDIVIAMTGATIGKIGIIPEIKNLYTNQRVGKIFPNKELTNPTPFVFCFYLQESILKQIVAISSSSSAQPNISGKQLESFEVITNIETINKFCDFTQPLFDKINMLYKQIQLLKQARDYLLPKLISGELEV